MLQVVASDARQTAANPAVGAGCGPGADCVGTEEGAGASGDAFHLPEPLRAGRCRGFRRRAEPAAGAYIDDPVGVADDIQLVLDHEEGIAGGFQAVEGAQESFRVGGMEAGGGFVEHVDDAEEIGAHLRGQPQALQFAGREGGGCCVRGKGSPTRDRAGPTLRPQEVFGDAPGDDGFLGMLESRVSFFNPRAPTRPRRGAGSSANCLSGTREMSAMSSPAKVTESDSRRSRLPWQSGQSLLSMNCDTRFFMVALSVCANVCSTWRRALVNVPM